MITSTTGRGVLIVTADPAPPHGPDDNPQALYDRLGSVRRVAEHWHCAYAAAHHRLKKASVTFNPTGQPRRAAP